MDKIKQNKIPQIAVIGLKGLPAFGGAAAVGENIINQLKDKYHFTIYSTSSHTELQTGDYHGFRQIVFSKIRNKKINTLYYYIISALHALIFGKYDLIHLHHRDAAFIVLILRLRYKVVITTHGGFFVRDKWKKFEKIFEINERYFVKKAFSVTCVSLEEKRMYKNEVGLDVTYIPNGINLESSFSLVKEKTKDNYIFFGAGRIIKSKGLDILLLSLKHLNFENELYIAGDIEQTYDYKNEIIQLSKGIKVKFLGLIKEKKELLNYISNAKLFIFPSSNEAMSMMLLEGISTKTPTIASDIIQNKDILSEDKVLYFKTDDYLDLANKINWAYENYEEMLLRANNAYQYCLENYNWHSIANQYNKIFEEILND